MFQVKKITLGSFGIHYSSFKDDIVGMVTQNYPWKDVNIQKDLRMRIEDEISKSNLLEKPSSPNRCYV